MQVFPEKGIQIGLGAEGQDDISDGGMFVLQRCPVRHAFDLGHRTVSGGAWSGHTQRHRDGMTDAQRLLDVGLEVARGRDGAVAQQLEDLPTDVGHVRGTAHREHLGDTLGVESNVHVVVAEDHVLGQASQYGELHRQGIPEMNYLGVCGVKELHLRAQAHLLDALQQLSLHARLAHIKLILVSERPEGAKPVLSRLNLPRRFGLLGLVQFLVGVVRGGQDAQNVGITVDGRGAVDLPAQEEGAISVGIKQRCWVGSGSCFFLGIPNNMQNRLTNVEQVPKGIPVLLVVEQQLDRLLSVVDGRLETSHRRSIGVLALQEATVPWDDIGPRIARHLDEAV